MNKEFATYEHALALKELGFDESYYFATYLDSANLIPREEEDGWDLSKGIIAPLYQQAFRWFREEHKISSSVIFDRDNGKYEYQCFSTISKSPYVVGGSFETYEEAEHACLDKLIQIVK